jgi:hypothetical protein
LLSLPIWAEEARCVACHPGEVKGYGQFTMAHSLRRATVEPPGSLQTEDGTKFTVYAKGNSTFQRLQNSAENSDYKVGFVVGSAKHASGYLVQIGDHLFQSPIAYYPNRRSYGLAPGYEGVREPDFTRPVTQECLLCHAGRALHIPNTINRFQAPVFEQEAISCDRCHGPTEQHLKRPVPGSIINPAKLQGNARDSICEQCHLSGIVRILNPGKQFGDFRPGDRLEQVFTVYRDALPPGIPPAEFKVISHPEQLAASACSRNSGGKLWCGTCHDPHEKPVNTSKYYAQRCLSCHSGKLPATHPPAESDCISCHMPRRPVSDGGHTVFTDHRIMRQPDIVVQTAATPSELVAWREPPAAFAKRNLALAYVSSGLARHLPSWIVRGYRMLTEVQSAFPDDVDVLNAFGTVLLQGNQPHEAKFAFDRVVALNPTNAAFQENAGRADLACGDTDAAVRHLERAWELDPLLLSAAGVLESVYAKQGDTAKQAALAARMKELLKDSTVTNRQ